MANNEPKLFLEIQALACIDCHLCFDIFIDGIPLLSEREFKCECGSVIFAFEDGKDYG